MKSAEILDLNPIDGVRLSGRGPTGGATTRPGAFALSPDAKWIASVADRGDTAIRLWPMPDLSEPPLHTLPCDPLIAKLGNLTNLRVIESSESSTGWGWSLNPFPGWRRVPDW